MPKALLRLRGDEDLVVRARQGDERAFELLYERHVPGVLSFCRHMLGDPAEAEDAVQHVFAAAHRELADRDRPLRLKAWLYTVARNRCLSVLRDRHEHPEEAVEPSTAGLDEEVQRRADLREVLTDLHDLPHDQRAALVLSELEDLSHAEIAGVIGCRVDTVKGLVFRARAGLMVRREAREAPCSDIRAELAVARRGGLRRGRLKHHLKACPSCVAYLEDIRRQRRMLALVLPVAPTAGLKPGLLASLGLGGGAAAGGLAAASAAGTAATLAVAAVVGGAGLVGQGPLAPDQSAGDRGGPPPGPKVPTPAPSAAARGGRATPGTPRRGPQPRSDGLRRESPPTATRGVGGGAAGRTKPPKAAPRGRPKGDPVGGRGPKAERRASGPSGGAGRSGGSRSQSSPPGWAKSLGSPALPKAKLKAEGLSPAANGGGSQKKE